jgi:fibronectin type 3 domain-containing protein/phenylpyruvate tautomerase PptA (4-oxalocrotonate tautomerase family)
MKTPWFFLSRARRVLAGHSACASPRRPVKTGSFRTRAALAALALSVFGAAPAAAATYYVSTTGNDANSGSSSAPFRTPAKAVSVATAGDTVNFAAGTYGTMSISGKNGTSTQKITFQANGDATFTANTYSSGTAIHVTNSSHIVIKGLIARTSLFGIMIEGVTNSEVNDCRSHDVGQEALHVRNASSNILIVGCEIYDTGRRNGATDAWDDNAAAPEYETQRYAEGIYIGTGAAGGENDGTHHVTVRDCDIYRTRAEAIDMKRGLHNIIVENNRIRDIRTKVRAAINVMDGPTGSEYNYVIRNNKIWNVQGERYDSDGIAIRIFGGGVDCYNNVVYNCEYAGIKNEGTAGGARRIYNNTVHNGGTQGNIWIAAGSPDVRNNIGSSLANNIASSSGLFVDAAAGDFRLVSGATAAINTGVTLSLVTTDIAGVSRPQGSGYDMGAYEYVSGGSAPAVPTNFSATAGDTQVALQWTASSGATSYRVKYGTTSGSYPTVISNLTATSHNVTGLVNGTTYYFVVTAVNANGESANSSQAIATPTGTLPPAPTNLTAVAGEAAVSLDWTSVSGATSYKVKYGTASGSYPNVISGLTSSSHIVSGLSNGTTYYFVVSTVNGSGESANSAQVSGAPQAALIWDTFSATNTNWTKAAGGTFTITGGNMELTAPAGFPANNANGNINVHNTTFAGDFELSVRARVTDNTSTSFDDVTVVFNYVDLNNYYFVNLSGANDAYAHGLFRVSGGTLTQLADFSTVIAPNTWYIVTVRRVGSQVTVLRDSAVVADLAVTGMPTSAVRFGVGSKNDACSFDDFNVDALSAPLPAAPGGLVATAGNAQVVLDWADAANATSYSVRYGTTSGSYPNVITGVTASARTVTGLTNGTTYYFVVSSVNASGESANSSQVSATPTAVIINDNFSAANSNWTKIAGGTFAVSSGLLELTAPLDGGNVNGNVYLHNTTYAGDFEQKVDVRATNSTTSSFEDVSVIFNYVDSSNYYYASFCASNDGFVSGLFRISGGTLTQLADITSLITPGTFYTITVRRIGNQITVLNGTTQVATFSDAGQPTGAVRFGVGTKNDPASFDNFIVSAQ